jgi:hypothetical protein
VRVVAKFQFVSSTGVELDAVSDILQAWGDSKFQTGVDGTTTIKKSGVQAIFDKRSDTIDKTSLVTFDVLEPVSGGQLQTQVKLLKAPEQFHFQCVLTLGSERGLVSPTVDIHSPRFIREIIELPAQWRVAQDAERVFAKCFDVKTQDITELERLIKASQRRLPIVVISELRGETLAGDVHERVSIDTCGLAHTCRLTSDASWELTNLLGKEWSCYNGAIRLFWPFRGNRTDPRAHPLWTMDRLLWRVDDEEEARDRFRRELNEQLIEASTFVADDPAFARFESSKLSAARESSRLSAEAGDYKALADSYASENDALRTTNDIQLKEIETLKQNIESLTLALRSERSVTTQDVPEAPPETVLEAVQSARDKLAKTVSFGPDIDRQLETLNSTAGPPDKVFRYLMTLGDLAQTLDQNKPLGRSVPLWLRDKNVEASGESETIKNSKDARRHRTFRIDGHDVHCEYHAKPSDGVHPDLCVRIYFAVSDQHPRIQIGYIGRHFE